MLQSPRGTGRCLKTLLPGVAQVEPQVLLHPVTREVPWTQAHRPGPGPRGWRVWAHRGGGGLESPGPSRCEQPPAASPPHFGGNGVALGCDCEQHGTLPLLHGCRGCAAAIPAPGVQRPFPFTAPCPGGALSPPANGEITQAPGRAQPAALTSGPSCLSRGRCLGPYGHRSPGWAGRGWGGLAGRRGCWDQSKRQHPPGLPAAAAEGLLPCGLVWSPEVWEGSDWSVSLGPSQSPLAPRLRPQEGSV